MESRAHARIAPTLGGYQGSPRPLRLHAPRQIHRADFEKPSLRTRVTFDVCIQSMGGSVVFLDHTQASASLGARESIADVARNLERWVQASSRAFTISVSSRKWRRTLASPWSTRFPTSFIPARRLPIFLHWKKNSAPCAASSSHTSATQQRLPFSDLPRCAAGRSLARRDGPRNTRPCLKLSPMAARGRETKSKIELMTDPARPSAAQWASTPIPGPAWI